MLNALYRIADLVAHVRNLEEIYDPAVDAVVAATGATCLVVGDTPRIPLKA
jgi:hypothetical protein